MPDVGLAAPLGDHDLYDLEPEALRLKPYMTGDVFSGVDLGDGGEAAVAVAGHPCVIRGSGGQLARRVPCCVVGSGEPMDYENWPSRKFHLFPLSDALGIGTGRAVKLLEWASVPRAQLQRDRRVATLTERGVYIFLQRFTHAITRCSVPLSRFEEVCRHILREAELEHDWVMELVDDGAGDAQIAEQVHAFQNLLDADDNRGLLRQEGGESLLRRKIRAAIREAGNQ